MSKVPYAQCVGSLMYLAVATRPDIAYAVGVLSRFSVSPGPEHWKAVKHLFRYLKGTMDLKMTYKPTAAPELFQTYSDADFAGCEDSKKSTSGYVVKMGSGAVSWASRRQTIQTLSTTEAEYISACAAGQELLWMRNLFSEFGYPSTSLPLYIDNQSAIAVAKNPEHHGRMKHLDLRHYWLRAVVAEGLISVQYLQTDAMPADVMTKALGAQKVKEAWVLLGLQE